MKIKNLTAAIIIAALSFFLSGQAGAQDVPPGTGCTIYELTPGMKGNNIILSLSNISEVSNAENIQVYLAKHSENLIFSRDEQTIGNLDAREETEAVFSFEVKREAQVNKKDTIEFVISDGKRIFLTKQFTFNYTGPKEYKLEQNFPNPFNPSTTIQYQIPADSKVILKVYDILGSEVATLVNEVQEAGYKEVRFDASSFASGIYIYRLMSGKYVSTKKMMVVK